MCFREFFSSLFEKHHGPTQFTHYRDLRNKECPGPHGEGRMSLLFSCFLGPLKPGGGVWAPSSSKVAQKWILPRGNCPLQGFLYVHRDTVTSLPAYLTAEMLRAGPYAFVSNS